MDAATYKDFIFGMLFLKRCSDVFEAAKKLRITEQHVARGMDSAEIEERFTNNPDYYDDFFVPRKPPGGAESSTRAPLNDAGVTYGSVLDKALAAVSEANETLEHVLDHIQFMRIQGNKRIVSDDACKDLVRHLSYRLRSEDFQFSWDRH